MEDFAQRHGIPAAAFEELRQGHDFRQLRTQEVLVVQDARRVWTYTAEQTGPRWIADRDLTVGTFKQGSACGELVDVR